MSATLRMPCVPTPKEVAWLTAPLASATAPAPKRLPRTCSMMSLACAIIDTPSALRACSTWIRGCTDPRWLCRVAVALVRRLAATAALMAYAPPPATESFRDERAWLRRVA